MSEQVHGSGVGVVAAAGDFSSHPFPGLFLIHLGCSPSVSLLTAAAVSLLQLCWVWCSFLTCSCISLHRS